MMEPISCPIRVSTPASAPRVRRSPQAGAPALPRKSDCPLNVVIPMGGLGRNDFTEAGYGVPKPLVPIVGRPMLFWLLDNLELQPADSVWLGAKRDVEAEYGIERAVRHEYPGLDVHFVRFDFDTRGATETLYCVLNAMDARQRARRTISLDCDTLWFCDVLGGARALPPDTGASFYFRDDELDDAAPYSYIRVDERTQAIVDIREKVAISRLANNGAYAFASAAQALAGLEDLLDEACAPPAREPAPKGDDAEQSWKDADDAASSASGLDRKDAPYYSHRHHYVSGLIARILAKHQATFLAVKAKDFVSLGTPAKLSAFLARLRRGEVLGARAMRFCFALDGTLVTTPDVPNAYDQSRPVARTVALARQLHAAGHTIIVWTDRGMDRSRGNAGTAMAEAGAITFKQLEEFGIPYDELLFGKPQADVYVDARAVSSLGAHVERALGWDLADDGAAASNSDLAGAVKPRHFNAVRRVGDDHVEKTGPRVVLRGEVYWYQHVPENLADLFPKAVSVSAHPDRDLSSVLLTRVNGVTFSHLAADACLTPGRLGALLEALRRLHVEPPRAGAATPSDALICSNYAAKVRARFEKHERFFRSFDDAEAGVETAAMAARVLAFLEDYERGARFQRAAHVHGDPVFSNVLLTHDGQVKFLDMRGALGDELTTAGDVAYDLSKVYQSLCGYDAIILDVAQTAANEATLARLRGVFEAWLARRYPKVLLGDIRMIVAAHYFCIVPLHDNKHHQAQFLAKAKWLLDAEAARGAGEGGAAAEEA